MAPLIQTCRRISRSVLCFQGWEWLACMLHASGVWDDRCCSRSFWHEQRVAIEMEPDVERVPAEWDLLFRDHVLFIIAHRYCGWLMSGSEGNDGVGCTFSGCVLQPVSAFPPFLCGGQPWTSFICLRCHRYFIKEGYTITVAVRDSESGTAMFCDAALQKAFLFWTWFEDVEFPV